jgi:hypothetical protein
MDKSLAGLLAVASVLAVPAQAATGPAVNVDAVMQVSSYADLLKPIPNALAVLRASAAAGVEAKPVQPAADGEPGVEQVQYWYYRHHHHHHHHDWWYRRRYHHHHHHHHHDS